MREVTTLSSLIRPRPCINGHVPNNIDAILDGACPVVASVGGHDRTPKGAAQRSACSRRWTRSGFVNARSNDRSWRKAAPRHQPSANSAKGWPIAVEGTKAGV
jgi:hypothetical protein